MINLKLKLNSTGDIDLVHYQRAAEQARAKALHNLLMSIGRKLKQLVAGGVVRVRSVRLARILPSSMLHQGH